MERIYSQWSGNPQGTPENITKCIEPVLDGVLFCQCDKNRGYGKDGLYCKIHAKLHPSEDVEQKEVYVYKFEYGIKLAKCSIAYVTAKTYVVLSSDEIFGKFYFGKNQKVRKDLYPYADTEKEAKSKLYSMVEKEIQKEKGKLNKLELQLKDLT